MPTKGFTAYFLLISREQATHLFSCDRMKAVPGKTDIFIELHHRKTPFVCQLTYRTIVCHTSIMPVGAEYNHGRFTHTTVVIFRSLLKFQIVAFGQISLYHVVETCR